MIEGSMLQNAAPTIHLKRTKVKDVSQYEQKWQTRPRRVTLQQQHTDKQAV